MKLGKEEIQKIVLGSLMLLGIVYVYFSLLLGPLVARQAAVRTAITDLDPQIAAAQAQIKKTAEAEAASPKATRTLAQVGAMIPDGSRPGAMSRRLDLSQRESSPLQRSSIGETIFDIEIGRVACCA